METRLLACPFCGEPGEPWHGVVDGCSSHGCACHDMAQDGCTTVAKWNRRAPSPAVREVVERFRAYQQVRKLMVAGEPGGEELLSTVMGLHAALDRLAKEIEE